MLRTEKETAMKFVIGSGPQRRGDGSFYLDLNKTERSGYQAGNSILDVGGSRTYNANTSQDAFGQVDNFTLTGRVCHTQNLERIQRN